MRSTSKLNANQPSLSLIGTSERRPTEHVIRQLGRVIQQADGPLPDNTEPSSIKHSKLGIRSHNYYRVLLQIEMKAS